ncbi:MAG: hypothetical protein ABI775_07100 [Pseudonocardiales bacterium]|nr:hypothetical protein [Actinomycetota bacterium]
MSSEPAPIVTVKGRHLVFSLAVTDELAVLSSEERTHLLNARNARRLAEELIAAADALDRLQRVLRERFTSFERTS